MALTTEVFAKCLEIQIQALQDQLGLLRGDAIAARGKKQKKVVDPNKPKRAHSAYNEYIKDMVPKLKIAHPNKIHKELMSMAANQWSNLDDDSKKVYVDAAARDKEKKLEEYNEAHPPTRNGFAQLGPSEEAVPSPPVLTQEMPVDQEHKKKKKKDKKRKSDAGDGSHHHKSSKKE